MMGTGAPVSSALVVAPHPDDETLGCGGMIARLAATGCDVYVIAAFCHDQNTGTLGHDLDPANRHAEFLSACTSLGVADSDVLTSGGLREKPELGIADLVEAIETTSRCSLANIRPDMLIIPADGAFHYEHQMVHHAGFAAARIGAARLPETPRLVLGCLGPEDHWRTGAIDLPVIVDISDSYATKQQALKCYQKQLKGQGHPRSIEAIEILDRATGLRAGVEYAEAFAAYRIAF